MKWWTKATLALSLFLNASAVQAAVHVFDNANDFLASVGGTTWADWSNMYSAGNHAASWIDRGGIRFVYGGGGLHRLANPYVRRNMTSLLDGKEIGVRQAETLHVLLTTTDDDFTTYRQVHSFGFYVAEPRDTPSTGPDSDAPFTDSTFQMDVFSAHELVHTFTFNVANDTPAFVGVWSDEPINQFDIVELTDDIGDEFFGDFYAGTEPFVIPAPSSLTCMAGLFAMGLVATWWRKRKASP